MHRVASCAIARRLDHFLFSSDCFWLLLCFVFVVIIIFLVLWRICIIYHSVHIFLFYIKHYSHSSNQEIHAQHTLLLPLPTIIMMIVLFVALFLQICQMQCNGKTTSSNSAHESNNKCNQLNKTHCTTRRIWRGGSNWMLNINPRHE